ncbi:hypothetical protein HK414_15885 [Ramlibacter terrae]|uniref:Uncharacterized protein n=1 Tax=Ramlibacter terrae TaxID=2732511 RepID=A0ABX6P3J4_9BURK|nr:hypothetical protein HK414_15885 [Ramlibacter terrae]
MLLQAAGAFVANASVAAGTPERGRGQHHAARGRRLQQHGRHHRRRGHCRQRADGRRRDRTHRGRRQHPLRGHRHHHRGPAGCAHRRRHPAGPADWGAVSIVAGGAIIDNVDDTSVDVYASQLRLEAGTGIASGAEHRKPKWSA